MLPAVVVALALNAGPSRPAADVHELLYFAPSGPVLIRLHMRIDGKPLRERFDTFMRDLFDSLDKDRDGYLNETEAAAMPQFRMALFYQTVISKSSASPVKKRERKLTFEQMKQFYAQTNLVPLQLGVAQPVAYVLAGADRHHTAITKRLFTLLDTNKDGFLDADELKSAPRIMQKRDENDDELLAVDELFPDQPLGPNYVLLGPESEGLPSEFVLVDARSRRSVAERLQGPGAALGRLRELDTNRDGRLSEAELEGLGAVTADLELDVEMTSKGELKIAPTRGVRTTKLGRIKQSGSETIFETGTTQFSLTGTSTSRFESSWSATVAMHKDFFRRLDQDKNGYLDRKEAMQQNSIAIRFDVIDTDKDGKIFEKEYVAYIQKLWEINNQFSRATIRLAITEPNQGLFPLLDLDGDGVLSTRELLRAPELLKRLNCERISLDNLPRLYQANWTPGEAGLSGPTFIPPPVAMPSAGLRPRNRKGPEWFQRMDRNGDGDVSQREWLGTREEFAKIDTDGDGLISLAEAEAYHKRVTEKRSK